MRRARILLTVVLAVPSAAPAQIINTLRSFEHQTLGWSGGIESTVAVADGNTDYFEFEADGSVQHLSDRQRWAILGVYMQRSASDVRIAENRLTHVRHNWRFLPWLASIAFVQGQHDPFRRLETRLLAGAGARFDVLKGKKEEGALGVSVMWEGEELTDQDGIDTDVRFSLFLNLYQPGSGRLETDVAVFYQPRVDEPADSRAFAAARLKADVVGGLYFVVRYSLQYESRPPEGVAKRDQTFRSGLGWEF